MPGATPLAADHASLVADCMQCQRIVDNCMSALYSRGSGGVPVGKER